MQLKTVTEMFAATNINFNLKNKNMKKFIFFTILSITFLSCSDASSDSIKKTEKDLSTVKSIDPNKEKSDRFRFFKNGGIDFTEKKLTVNFKTIEESEDFFDDFTSKNRSSKLLPSYKSMFSKLIIRKYNLTKIKGQEDKERFLKFFDAILEAKGGDYGSQLDMLKEVKPQLSQDQYNYYLAEVEKTKKENIEGFQKRISLLEKVIAKETNPESKRRAKSFLKIEKEALEQETKL